MTDPKQQLVYVSGSCSLCYSCSDYLAAHIWRDSSEDSWWPIWWPQPLRSYRLHCPHLETGIRSKYSCTIIKQRLVSECIKMPLKVVLDITNNSHWLEHDLNPNPLKDSPSLQPLSHGCSLTSEYKRNVNSLLNRSNLWWFFVEALFLKSYKILK